jgi:hypothetical protein
MNKLLNFIIKLLFNIDNNSNNIELAVEDIDFNPKEDEQDLVEFLLEDQHHGVLGG